MTKNGYEFILLTSIPLFLFVGFLAGVSSRSDEYYLVQYRQGDLNVSYSKGYTMNNCFEAQSTIINNEKNT
jgi:hypothetical protein